MYKYTYIVEVILPPYRFSITGVVVEDGPTFLWSSNELYQPKNSYHVLIGKSDDRSTLEGVVSYELSHNYYEIGRSYYDLLMSVLRTNTATVIVRDRVDNTFKSLVYGGVLSDGLMESIREARRNIDYLYLMRQGKSTIRTWQAPQECDGIHSFRAKANGHYLCEKLLALQYNSHCVRPTKEMLALSMEYLSSIQKVISQKSLVADAAVISIPRVGAAESANKQLCVRATVVSYLNELMETLGLPLASAEEPLSYGFARCENHITAELNALTVLADDVVSKEDLINQMVYNSVDGAAAKLMRSLLDKVKALLDKEPQSPAMTSACILALYDRLTGRYDGWDICLWLLSDDYQKNAQQFAECCCKYWGIGIPKVVRTTCQKQYDHINAANAYSDWKRVKDRCDKMTYPSFSLYGISDTTGKDLMRLYAVMRDNRMSTRSVAAYLHLLLERDRHYGPLGNWGEKCFAFLNYLPRIKHWNDDDNPALSYNDSEKCSGAMDFIQEKYPELFQ